MGRGRYHKGSPLGATLSSSMRRAGLACVLALASTASADTPKSADELRAEGEGHAKRQEYAEAIASFKEADRIAPQAIYSCMIGLTYMRRNLLAQAELFLGRCHTRARDEKLPAWVASADQQLAQALTDGKVSTFAITVTPATAGASVTVSGFAEDEKFDPQTIHLPAGNYAITVSAPSFPDVKKDVVSLGTHDVQPLAFTLEQRVAPPIDTQVKQPDPPVVKEPIIVPPGEDDPPVVEPKPSKLPLALFITGGALAAGGGVMHYITWKKADDLRAATMRPDYDTAAKTFERERIVTFSLYGAAAIALGIGTYLQLTSPESSTSVAAVPLDGGGMVTIGWQR